MVELIDEVKLMAVREGNYTMYVFQTIITKKFIMCTRMPNWQVPSVNIHDVGFLQYRIVKAGDEYYDPNLEKPIKYLYSNVYFMNFVIKSTVLHNNNEIII